MQALYRRACHTDPEMPTFTPLARHQGEAVKLLQKFEQERAKEIANDLGSAWLKAVRKAAEQEKGRSREREREREAPDRSR